MPAKMVYQAQCISPPVTQQLRGRLVALLFYVPDQVLVVRAEASAFKLDPVILLAVAGSFSLQDAATRKLEVPFRSCLATEEQNLVAALAFELRMPQVVCAAFSSMYSNKFATRKLNAPRGLLILKENQFHSLPVCGTRA
jgi:hypothetical protein